MRLFKSRYVGYCCSCAECEPESIACANKELFIDAMMYCEGVEYMIERLYSSRRNSYTTVDKEQAKELKDFYQVEYEKSMEYAVSNIPKETIENCFDCTGKISRVESLP